MKIRSILFIFPAVILLLSGCATGPKYTEVASGFDVLDPEKGRIYIYRPSAFGAAIQPKVTLNGEVVGKAVSHGFFFVDRAPGEYLIMTSTEVDRSLSVTLEKHETRYVRLKTSIGFVVGHIYPELVDPAEGQEEIRKLSYIGNTE
jgi:hypothetical protein